MDSVHIHVMSDHLQKQLDLLERGRATFCPRCDTYIDGGLECEPTMEVHNLKFCPFRPDAGPIKGGASNATTYVRGRRFVLGNGCGDHVRGVRIIDSAHANGSAAVDRPVSDSDSDESSVDDGCGDHVCGERIIDSAHANGSAAVDRPVSDSDESSVDDDRPKIRIGPEYQAAIPSVLRYYTTFDGTATLDGIVVPMPLTEMESRTEEERETQIAARHPERCRPDSPSPPTRNRRRSSAGARAGAVPAPVPVAVSVTTKKGRTVKPVEHFKPQ